MVRSYPENMRHDSDVDVLVVGAGTAGLSTARGLAEAGLRVVVLEASGRVGGRIFTAWADGSDLPIELGAEFVHGRPPELLALIEEAGLSLFEREGQFFQFEGGRLGSSGWDASFFEVLESLPANDDKPFAEFLAAQDLPSQVAARLMNYVEGFNAANARVIGTAALRRQQQAEDAIEGDRAFRIREGYARLTLFLRRQVEAAGGRIYLDTPVARIEWKPNEVLVQTRNAVLPEVRAQRVVITVPLGVLQAGAIQIFPMPEKAAKAIKALAMGSASRITLVFYEPFWETAAKGLSFLFTPTEEVPVWWSASPDRSPVLTGWMGGPRAQTGPTGEALRDAALATLEKVFGKSDPSRLLLSWHMHDWLRDEWSQGAYSYVPAGAMEVSCALAEPIDDTLYFAGEHTDTTGYWGTVHAALRSGMRVVSTICGRAGDS